MRTPLILTSGLAFAAIGTGFITAPGTLERLTMLIRDDRFETAALLGNDVYERGDVEPKMLARLFDLNSRAGDPEKAGRALLDYLAARPQDAAMLRRAVEFFEHQQDIGALTKALQDLVAITRDAAAIEQLARLLRLYGRYEEEKQLLLDHRGAAFSPSMARRAAGLLARDGAFAEAADILRKVDSGATPIDAESQPLLFEVLVKSGQTAEAADRASRWADAGLEPGLHALFVLTLALADADEDALRLATIAQPDSPDPSSLAWTLGERGRFELAQSVIDDWLKTADPATARRATRLYVDLAVSTGRIEQVLAKLYIAVSSPDPKVRSRAATLAAVLFERQGYAAIAPVRPFFTAELLVHEPLFAAAMSQQEKNVMAVRYFLLSSDMKAFGDDEAALWNSLAAGVLSQQETADTLMSHWQEGSLAPAMLPALQRAAERAGRFNPAWEILRDPPIAEPMTSEIALWSK